MSHLFAGIPDVIPERLNMVIQLSTLIVVVSLTGISLIVNRRRARQVRPTS